MSNILPFPVDHEQARIVSSADFSSPCYPPRYRPHIDAADIARILEGQFDEPAIVTAQREHEERVADDLAWLVGFIAFAVLFAGAAVWLS